LACSTGDDPRRLTMAVACDSPRRSLSGHGSCGPLGFGSAAVKRASHRTALPISRRLANGVGGVSRVPGANSSLNRRLRQPAAWIALEQLGLISHLALDRMKGLATQTGKIRVVLECSSRPLSGSWECEGAPTTRQRLNRFQASYGLIQVSLAFACAAAPRRL